MARRKERAPDQYFNKDYGSRYASARRAPTARSTRAVERSINEDPSESIASWVWNFDSMYTARLQSLINRGKFAEAAALYEEAKGVIDENEGNLFALTDLAGAGETSNELAARARTILNNPFSRATAKFNGDDVPLDAILRDGGSLAIDAAKEGFMDLGLSAEVSEAFFGDDSVKRATIRSLIQPLVSGQRGDHGQRIELAEDVVSNWDELYSLFGDGVTHFITRHQASHAGAGGASDSLRSLMAVARGINSANGMTGKDLAREVLGAYDGLVARTFARDTSDRDTQGRPQESPVSATKRMLFDSALASSVQALADRGISPDLRSAKFAKALSEVMDAQAFASDCGIDLVGIGHDTGHPIAPAFGQYIADSVTDTPQTGANPVNAFIAYRHLLDNQITGGLDFATQVYRATGNPEDYYRNFSKANGGFSSSPGADVIAKGVKSYLIQRLAPGMVAGLSPDDALRSARSGTSTAGGDFAVGLSAAIRQHLYGKGSDSAADLITVSVMDALDRGQKVTIEDIVRDLAFGENSENMNAEGVNALRNWYWGNVTQASEFASKTMQLRAHLAHGEGLPDYVVMSEVSKAGQEAGEMRRMGRDGSEVFDARLRAGTVYAPRVDPKTQQVMRDAANNPIIDRAVVPDRSIYGYDPDGDNTTFDAQQQQFREQYRYNQQYMTAAARAAGSQATPDS